MILDTVSLGILILATIIVLLFIVAVIKGKKSDYMIDNLEDGSFQLKELYAVGFAWSEMIPKLSYGSNISDKIKMSVQMLYDKKYSEYYTRLYLAKMVTFAHLIIAVFAILGAMISGGLGVFLIIVGIAAGILLAKSIMEEPAKKVKERADDCVIEFPNLVTKLALLLNAGITLREAWFKAANNTKGTLREMMIRSCNMMENGASDIEAITDFGNSSGSEEMRKFSMSVIQSIEKGNAELSNVMMQQSAELWELKKQKLLQMGERAATKLIIPISLMFLGVILVVLSSALTGLSI